MSQIAVGLRMDTYEGRKRLVTSGCLALVARVARSETGCTNGDGQQKTDENQHRSLSRGCASRLYSLPFYIEFTYV